jgi:hypothetical protein
MAQKRGAPVSKAGKKKSANKKLSTKEKAATKNRGPARQNFQSVFDALRQLLSVYEDRLACKSPKSDYYYLESTTPRNKKRPMAFAGVRTEKNYVAITWCRCTPRRNWGRTCRLSSRGACRGKGASISPQWMKSCSKSWPRSLRQGTKTSRTATGSNESNNAVKHG